MPDTYRAIYTALVLINNRDCLLTCPAWTSPDKEEENAAVSAPTKYHTGDQHTFWMKKKLCFSTSRSPLAAAEEEMRPNVRIMVATERAVPRGMARPGLDREPDMLAPVCKCA